jgi:hypothetical protein
MNFSIPHTVNNIMNLTILTLFKCIGYVASKEKVMNDELGGMWKRNRFKSTILEFVWTSRGTRKLFTVASFGTDIWIRHLPNKRHSCQTLHCQVRLYRHWRSENIPEDHIETVLELYPRTFRIGIAVLKSTIISWNRHFCTSAWTCDQIIVSTLGFSNHLLISREVWHLCRTWRLRSTENMRLRSVLRALPLVIFSVLTVQDPLSWWKTAVVYQLYPLRFRDSNGVGNGDLNGTHERAT